VTETRKHLTDDERVRLLTKDAMEVVELTLQAMKFMLESHASTISASQLCAILKTLTPYIMIKWNNKKEAPRENIFKILKGA